MFRISHTKFDLIITEFYIININGLQILPSELRLTSIIYFIIPMDQYENDDYGENVQSLSNSEGSLNSQSDSQEEQQQQNPEQEHSQGSDWTLEEDSQETKVEQMLAKMQIIEEVDFQKAQKRITAAMLTKYEKAMVIGLRATQISKGSPIYLNLTKTELETWSPIEIAQNELQEGVIPFVVRRTHPDGKFEDWKLCQFKNLDK